MDLDNPMPELRSISLPAPVTGAVGVDGPRVKIETHGCKLNMADSQRMAREFMSAGYAIAADG